MLLVREFESRRNLFSSNIDRNITGNGNALFTRVLNLSNIEYNGRETYLFFFNNLFGRVIYSFFLFKRFSNSIVKRYFRCL